MNKRTSKSLTLDLQEVKCGEVVKGNIQAEDEQGLEKLRIVPIGFSGKAMGLKL